MKQVFIRNGRAVVEEVPLPLVGEKDVLVQVAYSCISTGTEVAQLAHSARPSLLGRVIQRPQAIRKAAQSIVDQGARRTFQRIKGELDIGSSVGYSCAGVAIEVGKSLPDIKAGDRVACAGAGFANHAEFVGVPQNLAVKVPESLDLAPASTVALGAIALQGVRRAQPNLGETAVIIGLGSLGQLIAQMLRLSACRVIGMDLDKARVELASKSGMDYGFSAEEEDIVDRVTRLTDGQGADFVIIAAATESDEPANQAMQMCRRKGRVVVVGDVGLGLKREEMYRKELDFLMATSYGPGRYDPNYEEKGWDYPYGYVRWTQNRNMQEYLRLLAERKIDLNPLIEREFTVDEAELAYKQLREAEKRPLLVLLKYSSVEDRSQRKVTVNPILVKPVLVKKEGRINTAIIGAGGHAQAVHLPNLAKLKEYYSIYCVASRTGSNAKAVAKKYNATYATTDYQEVLNDKDVDLVFVCTRHNLHAQMAMEAAKAGKAVFVEKPMALDRAELDELVKVLSETGVPYMVGFNRRFSPLAIEVKEIVKDRVNPMVINYRANAGHLPPEHWSQSEEGGGRIIGEACHFFDLFNYLTDAEAETVEAQAIQARTTSYLARDNFTALIKYKDGSLCTLIYTSLGSKYLPKEYMEVYVDGKALILDDYRRLEIFGSRIEKIETRGVTKGHLEELERFARCIKGQSELPIPMWQLMQATHLSFEVDEKVKA